MRKSVATALAIAAALSATPAWADGNNTGTDNTAVSVGGDNTAKCNVTTTSTSVTLPTNRVSTNDGFAASDVATLIAAQLNTLGASAWCTGANNTVTLARTSLIRSGSNGGKTSQGFNQALIYDLSMSIAGLTTPGGNNGNGNNGNGNGNGGGNGNGNNGCGNGNGGPNNPANCGGGPLSISTTAGIGSASAGRFGPTGGGNAVTFTAVGTSNATSTSGTGTGPRSLFTLDAARLAAGAYTGTVTVTLSPGV